MDQPPKPMTEEQIRAATICEPELGPMCMFCFSSFLRICDWSDWVFETFLDVSRSRSSMFMKSTVPPEFSW